MPGSARAGCTWGNCLPGACPRGLRLGQLLPDACPRGLRSGQYLPGVCPRGLRLGQYWPGACPRGQHIGCRLPDGCPRPCFALVRRAASPQRAPPAMSGRASKFAYILHYRAGRCQNLDSGCNSAGNLRVWLQLLYRFGARVRRNPLGGCVIVRSLLWRLQHSTAQWWPEVRSLANFRNVRKRCEALPLKLQPTHPLESALATQLGGGNAGDPALQFQPPHNPRAPGLRRPQRDARNKRRLRQGKNTRRRAGQPPRMPEAPGLFTRTGPS